MAPQKRSRDGEFAPAPAHTHVVFFRSLNVGGKNVIKMRDLQDVMLRCGAASVKTYIQSGNCVYSLPHGNHDEFCAAVVSVLEKDFAVKNTAAIWRSGAYLNRLLTLFAVPSNADKSHVMWFLFSRPVVHDALNAAIAAAHPAERVVLPVDTPEVGSQWEVLVHFCSGSVTKSKLNGDKIVRLIDKKPNMEVSWTARNWSTVERLVELLNEH